MWVCEQGAAKIARVTLTGAVTEFTDHSAFALTAGPDNNIWATNGADSFGAVTQYPHNQVRLA
jgi:hypothetical protein